MRWMIAGGLAAALVAFAYAQEKISGEVCGVQVREVVLREKPSFLGKVVGRLGYGAVVTVEERKDKRWLRVTAVDGKQTGWLAETSLSPDPTKLRAASGKAEDRADTTSRSLASRGFNEKAEQARAAQGGNAAEGYRLLDELLAQPAYNADPAAVPEFAQEGGLGGGR